MQTSELKLIVENWTKQVETIVEQVEEWSGQEIEIDVPYDQAMQLKKFQLIKARYEEFSSKMNERLSGLRENIVNLLHGIYEKAMEKFQTYKPVVEVLTSIASLNPSAVLTSLLTAIIKIIKAICNLAKMVIELFTEPLTTIITIIVLGSKCASLASKLSSLKAPKVKFKDGKIWTPSPPSMPSISLADITGGSSPMDAIDISSLSPEKLQELDIRSLADPEISQIEDFATRIKALKLKDDMGALMDKINSRASSPDPEEDQPES